MKRGILILFLFISFFGIVNAENCLIENYVPSQIMNIKEGWNLLSFPVENSINITRDLQNENCLIFKAWEYNFNQNNFIERKILESGKSYYLYSIKNCSFNLSNFEITIKTNVNLNYGWNIVSGTNNFTKNYPNMNGVFWTFGNLGYEPKLLNLTSFDAGWIFLNSSSCAEEIIVPLIGTNKKNINKYSEKEVFLVSDKNWKEVLQLIPVTTFTQQDGDDSICQRGYGTPENVCVYPTLIYHDEIEEKNAFDIDSSIYFMQQFNTEKVKVIGEIPEELNNLLIAEKEFGAGISQENIKRIDVENYLSYWESYEDIVYVQEDYELSLLASTYASLLNAPLIIAGTELDRDENFEERNIICVGNVLRQCNENYNLETLQEKYIEMTEFYDGNKTDKIILTNPNDLEIFVSEEFQPEKSTNPIYEIYGKTSLASPILASAKHEVIITTRESDYEKVDEKIEREVGRLFENFLDDVVFERKITLPGMNTDIYLYDLETQQEKIIGSQGLIHENVIISGNKIVWQDNRNGNYDIYLYDLETNTETQITFDSFSQTNPSISGNRIVWEHQKDWRSSNIYLYDLETQQEIQITSGFFHYLFPLISENKVFWQLDKRDGTGNWDVYMYDLEDSNELIIKNDIRDLSSLSVSADKVVWSFDGDIYLYDLEIQQEIQITSNLFGEYNPKIFGNKIVWRVYRGGNNNIYIHDLETQRGMQVTSDGFYYRGPLISGNKVVWLGPKTQKMPFYKPFLTVFGFNQAISFRGDLIPGWNMRYNLDTTNYADFNGDNSSDISVGRIQGISVSDVYSYLMRDLFYNQLSETFDNISFLVGNGYDDPNGALYFEGKGVHNWSTQFRSLGYFVECTVSKSYSNSCFNYTSEDKIEVWQNTLERGNSIYLAHHGWSGGTGIISNQIPNLKNGIFFSESCSTCSLDNGDSFCNNLIRKGALGNFAAISATSGLNNHKILQDIYMLNMNLGTSFSKYSMGNENSLLGDPTFRPYVPYKLNEELEWE